MACSDRSGRWKVALVGRRLTDNENLGLSYLAAALDEAGFGYERFVLNQADDVGRVGDAILRGGFDMVGLSIPDGGSAYLPLAFGELLQHRGYHAPSPVRFVCHAGPALAAGTLSVAAQRGTFCRRGAAGATGAGPARRPRCWFGRWPDHAGRRRPTGTGSR